MPMPVRQSLRVGAYILAQRLRRREVPAAGRA